MCGINGLLQKKRIFDRERLRNIIHIMNDQIVHRGPDEEGIYADDNCAFGMRRLAIIDINGGSQPIWNENKDVLIVFNGEIYNYRELRKELIIKGHTFSTESDTETILHGYEEYGIEVLNKLDGMFSFAIYDIKCNKILIARDRIGEKPLYYYNSKDLFIFGSELKSLLDSGLINKSIDRIALSRYFQLTYIPAPKTIFEDVYKLPAGYYLVINGTNEPEIKQYWNLRADIEEKQISNYEECKKKLRYTLFDSVEKRMISDVPIGVFLSGGFDSSIIAGIMSNISSEPIDTFTVGFHDEQFDESELAALVAKKNNTRHHLIMLDWNNVLGDLDTLLCNIDEPFADSSLIATYAVSKLAKQYVTVVLTGDAGDELFAGYNKYLISYYSEIYNRFPRALRNKVIEPLICKLPSEKELTRKLKKVTMANNMDIYQQRKQMMMLGLKDDEICRLLGKEYIDDMSFIREQYEYLIHSDEQTRAQFVDLKIVLEGDMLAKVDRASMLASVETRVPMLSKDMVELAYRIPSTYKINRTKRKIILKDTFQDLLPKELFKAPKRGFGVPIGKWLKTELKDDLYRYAQYDFIVAQGLFNYEYIHNLISEHMNNTIDRYSELWAFYVFQNWYERTMNT